MFLGCINKATPSRDTAVISPLYWALFGLHLEFCVHFCSLLWKIDMDRLVRVQSWPQVWSEDWKGCHMRKGWTVQPWEKVVMGRPYVQTTFQYLKGGYKGEDLLFTRCHMEKTRDKGCKLLLGRFSLDIRGKFFTMRSSIGINLPGKSWTAQNWHF